jgi:hypothetical protein
MASDGAENSNRYQRLFQILVPVLSLLLSIVALELGLAIFHPIPFSIGYNMYFVSDPYTGYRLKPGGTGYYQLGIPGIANRQGHRDVEVAEKKPSGVFRILVLGDSFTVGSNVRQEEAWPKVLERQLRDRYGPKIEVVNAGVGGWDPLQYAQYYEHYGYRFEPDLILVGFFTGNDTYSPLKKLEQSYRAVQGHLVSPEAAASRSVQLKVFLYDHSNLARLWLNKGPVQSENFHRKKCDEFSEQYLAIQKARLPNHLKYSDQLKQDAQDAVDQIGRIKKLAGNVPVIVALLPDENQVNPDLQKRLIGAEDAANYDFGMPQSMLTRMFRDAQIPSIDLLPSVQADRRCLYMNDTHWTPQGQALAASIVLSELNSALERMMRSR